MLIFVLKVNWTCIRQNGVIKIIIFSTLTKDTYVNVICMKDNYRIKIGKNYHFKLLTFNSGIDWTLALFFIDFKGKRLACI